ncbi:MAG: DNA translocase FtsK [Anaerolineales bacterium]|nr:DNA translocase FtsK [Anaerolineales bacterium]MCX7756314.1 DNA translocase FtsK [Anaerolineales bacterium]MDW8278532.1 DNA translocase FtsK [Anaerolineales bacterium]
MPRESADRVPPPASLDWFDWLERTYAHFGRFASDAAGVILLAFSLMTLLALIDLTGGLLLTPWANLLWKWLGWGSAFVVIASGLAGLTFLRQRVQGDVRIRWGQVIALEIAAFSALACFALLGGVSIERAAHGEDGGYLGWALAELTGILLTRVFGSDVLRAPFIVLTLLLSLFFGFDLLPKLEQKLWQIAGETPPESHISAPEVVVSSEAEPQPAPSKPAPPPKKPVNLPPQFRKNFKIPEPTAEKTTPPPPRNERLPPLNLLFGEQTVRPDERHINQTAGLIEKTLSEFGIPAKVTGFRIGPTVTQFAVQPGFIKKPGASSEEEAQLMKVRVAQIAALQKDLALALSAERLRIEAPVPGRAYVGIEVPNQRSTVVRLRPLLESEAFQKLGAPLAIALGRDVSGQPLVADLARMPHLLVAGQTGSGKSVAIAALATCLAMNNAPEDLRLVMIDAKMVELIRFNGLPHLLGKVETDVQRILGVLRWLVVEMEHRYRLLEGVHARDIAAYNRKVKKPLPRIVAILDELADLMMSAPDQTEHHLVRLAQMARATGIHLVVATQRPSTDVVTGLIKANFPARLAFAVASSVDSRVILDTPGAESLLGRGDLLFLNPEVGNPIRAQGVMVTDQEIERVIAFWQKMSPNPVETPPWETLLTEPEDGEDGLLEQAIQVVRSTQRASASLLQRRLKIGYPRAARLLDQLEEMGIVGPSQGGGREREVLVERETDDEDLNES